MILERYLRGSFLSYEWIWFQPGNFHFENGENDEIYENMLLIKYTTDF